MRNARLGTRAPITGAHQWLVIAEAKRKQAPKEAARLMKEADAIEEMLRRLACPQCEAAIDVPRGDQYDKAYPTHQLDCPYK